ncbi:arsenic transporter [Micrococcaceae bacterium RIT802]|nr:arsenic transporter [Micrococcaceae bacterium RIT 802]
MPLAVIGTVLLLLGAVAVACGVLPVGDVVVLADRVVPVLGFAAAITVVSELLTAAGLFDWIAGRIRRWGRGRAWLLWLLVCALAVVVTAFLSLDTTAVLLTPVVVVLARSTGLPPLPLALSTAWLANTASLFLPISNLTNLLAAHRLDASSPVAFAARMALPASIAVLVPLLVLALVFRRELGRRTGDATGDAMPAPVADRTLLAASALVLAALLPALLSGVAVWVPATAAALLLVVLFAVRRPRELTPRLVPWPLLLFASGLFLAMAAAQRLGLQVLADPLLGSGAGPADLLRVAGAGALGANVLNNLPAYLLLEPAAGSGTRLLALLIGVNAGALVTPWASLATLLWHDRLARMGVRVAWGGYVLLGLLVVPLAVGGAVLALAR